VWPAPPLFSGSRLDSPARTSGTGRVKPSAASVQGPAKIPHLPTPDSDDRPGAPETTCAGGYRPYDGRRSRRSRNPARRRCRGSKQFAPCGSFAKGAGEAPRVFFDWGSHRRSLIRLARGVVGGSDAQGRSGYPLPGVGVGFANRGFGIFTPKIPVALGAATSALLSRSVRGVGVRPGDSQSQGRRFDPCTAHPQRPRIETVARVALVQSA
jgi:hypothetical protein